MPAPASATAVGTPLSPRPVSTGRDEVGLFIQILDYGQVSEYLL